LKETIADINQHQINVMKCKALSLAKIRISASTMTTTLTSLLFTFSTTTALLVAPPNIRPDTSDYRSLLLNDAPMMDVRAPVEYEKGSFPSARNFPLMTNDERHLVGICYKEQGQDAAIALGHQLVCGPIKEERVKLWTNFANDHASDGYLYCFRGGLRSQTVQSFIEEETGFRLPLVTGGYKDMRQFLLDELDRSLAPERTDVIRICGSTGSGKTKLLLGIPETSIDLEGLAHHRGSAFGRLPEDPEQPSQIDFENSISIRFMKLLDFFEKAGRNGKASVFVEDEGNRIGNVNVPLVLRERMHARGGAVVIVDEDLEERVNMVMEDYIFDLGRRYAALFGSDHMEEHRDFILSGLARCRKRMGGERHDRITSIAVSAFAEQAATGDTSLHRVWVERILVEYYDPMYEYQLEQSGVGQVLFRGKRDAVMEYCKAYA
jgi:tRNA 2-selenouridine synthase